MKILLAEDNEMNRDMLSRRLERKGYTVLIAEDGEKAVEMATANEPDLICPKSASSGLRISPQRALS